MIGLANPYHPEPDELPNALVPTEVAERLSTSVVAPAAWAWGAATPKARAAKELAKTAAFLDRKAPKR